jgi:hypothetical protein
MADRRRIDAESARQIRLQAHRGEFGRPDREPADREREVDKAGIGFGSLS